MSATDLARLQFTITIVFHYIFPPLTIGLGTLMVFMEAAYLRTGNKLYADMTRFWTKIFAATFAMGVATGIVMEFQFGTNWSAYSRFVGDVFGSALAAEGIFAFFLESGFLAVLVFGWDRVSPRVHFFATVMVALGSIFSAIWIVVANSWMQTPAGYHIMNGRAEITDFWQLVFNPSTVQRLSHTLFGAFIMGAFFVMSVTGYYIIRGRHLEFAKRCFTIALVFGTAVSICQLALGHAHAVQVARTQPPKLAAFEGLYKTPEGGAPLHLIGVPDDKEQRVKYSIHLPGFLSFLVHGNFTTQVPGLDQVSPADRPPVKIPFYTYHTMVGLGTFFIGITLFALFLLWRGKLFQQKWLMWIFVFAVLGPYAANMSGWTAAEVGRQPWIVYGLMRTVDGVSRTVRPVEIVTSIGMFSIVYLFLFAVWVFVLNDKIQHGPEATEMPARTTMEGLMDAASRQESEDYTLTKAKPRDHQAGLS